MATSTPVEFYYPPPATPELTPPPVEPYPVFFDEPLTLAPLPAPTLTPGPLRVWTTAPNAQAESARQFVARQVGLGVDQLIQLRSGPVIRPATGEQLWYGSITSEERWFNVLVQSDGQAGFLDLSGEAKAALAQELNLPADDLHLLWGGVTFLPLTRQLLWHAQLRTNRGGSPEYTVFLDLDGNRIDASAMTALSQTENAVQAANCPKLDAWLLCPALFDSPPEAEFDVYIQATSETVAERLQQAGYGFQVEPAGLRARLPKYVILELAALEAVTRIFPVPPEPSTAPESNLLLTLQEVGGQFTLQARTQRIYGCADLELVLQAVQPEPQQFEILIGELRPSPYGCSPTAEPAQGEVVLGALDGTYTLQLIYGDLQDVYQLTVTPDRVSVQPVQTLFTWPQYETWLRLPTDALWFLVTPGRASGNPVDRVTFEAEAERFFAAVEDLGATPFTPAAGVYSQRQFVPLWPDWLRETENCTILPIDTWDNYCVVWPIIRYYHYSGSNESLRAFIESYPPGNLQLHSYRWDGVPLGNSPYP